MGEVGIASGPWRAHSPPDEDMGVPGPGQVGPMPRLLVECGDCEGLGATWSTQMERKKVCGGTGHCVEGLGFPCPGKEVMHLAADCTSQVGASCSALCSLSEIYHVDNQRPVHGRPVWRSSICWESPSPALVSGLGDVLAEVWGKASSG